MTDRRPPLERLLTIKEAAETLCFSEKTLRRRIDNGEITIISDGRIIRIEPNAVRLFIARHRIE